MTLDLSILLNLTLPPILSRIKNVFELFYINEHNSQPVAREVTSSDMFRLGTCIPITSSCSLLSILLLCPGLSIFTSFMRISSVMGKDDLI